MVTVDDCRCSGDFVCIACLEERRLVFPQNDNEQPMTCEGCDAVIDESANAHGYDSNDDGPFCAECIEACTPINGHMPECSWHESEVGGICNLGCAEIIADAADDE